MSVNIMDVRRKASRLGVLAKRTVYDHGGCTFRLLAPENLEFPSGETYEIDLPDAEDCFLAMEALEDLRPRATRAPATREDRHPKWSDMHDVERAAKEIGATVEVSPWEHGGSRIRITPPDAYSFGKVRILEWSSSHNPYTYQSVFFARVAAALSRQLTLIPEGVELTDPPSIPDALLEDIHSDEISYKVRKGPGLLALIKRLWK